MPSFSKKGDDATAHFSNLATARATPPQHGSRSALRSIFSSILPILPFLPSFFVLRVVGTRDLSLGIKWLNVHFHSSDRIRQAIVSSAPLGACVLSSIPGLLCIVRVVVSTSLPMGSRLLQGHHLRVVSSEPTMLGFSQGNCKRHRGCLNFAYCYRWSASLDDPSLVPPRRARQETQILFISLLRRSW